MTPEQEAYAGHQAFLQNMIQEGQSLRALLMRAPTVSLMDIRKLDQDIALCAAGLESQGDAA